MMQILIFMWRCIRCANLAIVIFVSGCGMEQEAEIEESSKTKPIRYKVKGFSDEELSTLRDLGIAIFRGKIILDAQPPISKAQLSSIETQVDGKVSPELLALWRVSFGGELDYDFEVMFGDHLFSTSFRELFYPGSKHYHDLDGWIAHELDVQYETAIERGQSAPDRIPFIPFGGFEYLERFYVSLHPKNYGTVFVYAQGIPWKGRLNDDSITTVAASVVDLFDKLSLDEDPFDEESDEFASGKDMVGKILEIEGDHPELAKKIKELVRASIFDWKSVIETTDFSKQLSTNELRGLRLALSFAIQRKDTSVIKQLHKKGAPFNKTIQGTGGVLDFAMRLKSFDVVETMLDLKLDVGDAPILFASDCPNELLLRLIDYDVRFDEEAIYSAAKTGATNGAIALVKSKQVVNAKSNEQIAAVALERAAQYDEDAVDVETGKLGSYLTADDYRDQAEALRIFVRRLNELPKVDR